MPNQILDSLTPRELEVLTLIGEGASLNEIARKLHRSLKTVESHRLSLGRKLKASNRVELAKIAIASGLVPLRADAMATGPGNALSAPPQQELAWLGEISHAVYDVTGQRYLDRLCEALCRVLGVHFAAVCLPDPESNQHGRMVISLYAEGRPAALFRYDESHTPVQDVVKHGMCRVTQDLASRYPNDPLLVRHGVQSYLGLRLDSRPSLVDGVLAISDVKPMAYPDTYERVLRFFSSRTATELEAVRRGEELYRLQGQLESMKLSPILPGRRDPTATPDGLDDIP